MFPKWFKDIHWPLVFAAAGLVAIGSLFIFSAAFHDSGNYEDKHLFWVAAATCVLFMIPLMGYRTFLSISYLFYVIAILLLISVFIFGKTRLGAQRWLSLGPLIIQPSEFAKLATVLAVANFLGSNNPLQNRFQTSVMALGMAILPFLLIAKQPDLGSAMLFLPMAAALLFLWGVRYRVFIISTILVLIAAPLGWEFLKAYQRKRILVFLNPNLDPLGSGYTAVQSKIAVGSGGLFGKGYMAGTQSQLQFVPEHHTDFIFCVIAEEWGFAGTVLVLTFYGLLFRSAFQVMEGTTDIKAKLLIMGVMAILFTQTFVNIGMSFGLMPITGITLPLISYGGSSLIATSVALGLILSIYKERSIF
jgi:rod shape determining protein RodA